MKSKFYCLIINLPISILQAESFVSLGKPGLRKHLGKHINNLDCQELAELVLGQHSGGELLGGDEPVPVLVHHLPDGRFF